MLSDVQNVNHVIGIDPEKTMVLIIRSPKYGIKEVLIDSEDYDKIKNKRWCVSYDSKAKEFYVKDTNNIYGFLHRFILNAKKGMEVDHINHNTLDERKENLRQCNRFENARNSKISRCNTSGYKGVCYNNKRKKWASYIYYCRKRLHIGYYETQKEAALHYNHYAQMLHGEFSCLNKLEAI
jgi:hypothetical protein